MMTQYGDGPRTGGQMYFYYDTGVSPTVTWPAALTPMTAVCPVTDLSIDDNRNTADLRYRCADVAYGLPAKRNPVTATFRLVFGLDTAFWDILRVAYDTAEIRFCWFASAEKTVSGATGLVMPMFPSAYPHDQPLEDVAGHDIVMTFGYLEDGSGDPYQPDWHTIA